MASETIDKILAARRAAEAAQTEADKFYSVISGEGLQESFLELQFKNGLRTAFAYSDLSWFNFDPDASCMDMEFGSFLVTLKGRGLYPAVFQAIKNRRVAWIKEADSEMQDHERNEVFIGEILVTPPEDFGGEEEETKE
jgi:hypothetical protein